MSFHVAERDYTVMSKAMEKVGLDPNKARKLVDALFKADHMLIDGNTYHELEVCANTYGPAS